MWFLVKHVKNYNVTSNASAHIAVAGLLSKPNEKTVSLKNKNGYTYIHKKK